MRICCVSPHQLLNNPRVVREATTLARAGHEVRVVAVKKRPEHSALEASAVAAAPWRFQPVDIERTKQGRWNWLRSGVRQKAARAVWNRVGRGRRLAGLAYARTFSETVRLIASEPTDLIIAHAQPALAPAWFAARRLGCRWAFDCEDILSEEYADRVDRDLIRYVERTFIPEAGYVSVASSEFSSWLSQHHGIGRSVFLANVPSLDEAPAALAAGYPDARPYLSLYWFSMSIGPHRGLEDALRAIPLIKTPVKLHVRGALLRGYQAELRQLATSLQVTDRLVLHGLVAPDQVVKVAADHDIGLLLSQPCCENHQMWMPNKLFAYLMAGLAIGATATRGHRAALGALPVTGFVYEAGDVSALAASIDRLAADPSLLRACRGAAFHAARTRLNWEVEQGKLLDTIDGLEHGAGRAPVWHAAHA